MRQHLLHKRWPWIVAAGALILALLSTFVEVRLGSPGDPRPLGTPDDIAKLAEREDLNLLFIVIDTLRADRLGTYGYERDTSPELDRWAAEGVRFDRHLAQSSWTKTSMASLWSGMNPVRSGITRFDDVLPDDMRMPAEILRERGFLTAGIYRNGWVAPTFGFDKGFDVYTRPAPRPLPPSVKLENPTIKERGTDEDAVADAIEFLRIHGRKRWFLYVHLMDVHEYLYDEESALFGGSYSDIYDNSIRWTDGTLAILRAHLDDMGLSQKTLVAIVSDHGEAFRERGFEGHARAVYRESTEVPFLLFLPFRLEPGVVVKSRTRNVDVWPTLFDLLGIDPPQGIDGRSLEPDILAAARGEAPPEADRVGIAFLDQSWGQREQPPVPTVAVVDGPLRYVRILDAEQLFDASADPRELEDGAERDPENLARLRGLADASLAVEPAYGEAPTRKIDELELNQLRALGYAIP
jgi:arylsulfatase A-like enzyme